MATVKEKFADDKARLDALLEFANSATGESDANIGDAIKTLVDGFGQGGSGGLDFLKGTITLDEASRTITIPKKQDWEKFAIMAIKTSPIYEVNGANGFVFVNKTPTKAKSDDYGGYDTSIHVVLETRTTWSNYNQLQANNSSLTAYEASNFLDSGDSFRVPCRTTSYLFHAGEYDYISVCLDGSGGGSGGVQLPGKTVVIDGACEIYVGDLGDYGYGIRIDPENVGKNYPIMCHWNPTRGLTLTYLRNDNAPGTGNYASYWNYYPDEHKFIYNGATTSNYNMRGTWQFIPYTVN